MNIKKNIAFIALLALMAGLMSGCVTVIDRGTEAQYTGVVEFDAAADSSSDWAQVVSEISGKAQALDAAIDAGIADTGTAVTATGTVTEFISKANGKKNSLVIDVNGKFITMQIGSIYTGTAIRDTQTLKTFGSFVDQTQWSEYAKALNAEMHAQVVEPLGIDESIQGKTITFTGVATAVGREITVTPIAITIE